jgi:hypothetical protein
MWKRPRNIEQIPAVPAGVSRKWTEISLNPTYDEQTCDACHLQHDWLPKKEMVAQVALLFTN